MTADETHQELVHAATELVSALRSQGRTIAVAESLTGGLLASTLVEVPGVSQVLRGGVVAYATEVKSSVLGVDAGLLARQSPVDPEVADAMAVNVARLLEADYGVSTTGVAGPDPQDGHPVGEVYISVVGPGPDGPSWTQQLALDPALGRSGIRRVAVQEALALVADHVAGADTSDSSDSARE